MWFKRLLLSGVIVVAVGLTALAAEFYVAPAGNDADPGTKVKPFATLEKARNAARSLKRSGTLPAGGITIWMAGGVYPRMETFTLTAEDSGSKAAPMVYRAADADVRLVAGRVVPPAAFQPVADRAVLARLDAAAKGHVVQLDLHALGVRHAKRFPDLFQGGGGILQLFFNNARMPLSRWPNDGYTSMQKVLDSGMKPQRHPGTFVYRGDRPARWQDAARQNQLWISGFWRVPWVIQTVRVQSIDTARKTIALSVPIEGGIGSKYSKEVDGTRRGDGKEPWYAINLLEEIDRPGEWCIDFAAGILYFWPPADLAKATVLLADVDTPIVSIQDASYVTLAGLTLEGGLGDALHVQGGEANLIAGCTVRNTGRSGVSLAGGRGNGVQSCDLYNLGAEGIVIDGGDRKTLAPAGHFALNNHVHHCGQVQKIVSGIKIDGVGNRAAHNLIHDGTYGGVVYHGNDHVLELNEIHNIGLDGGDLGAFYSNADWASRGTIIRHNFIHHAPNANGVYMDDGHSGERIVGNVMYRIRSGPFIGGGHDNSISNNVMVQCESAVHLDDRGVSRRYTAGSPYMMSYLKTIPYTQPPWSLRYPTLPEILLHPTLPTGNVVEGNACIRCGRNLDFRMAAGNRHYIHAADNLESGEIARLFDAALLTFNLRKDSPLAKRLPGFQPIPFEHIGLCLDEYRRTLPTARETGRNENRPPRQMFDSNIDMERSNKDRPKKP